MNTRLLIGNLPVDCEEQKLAEWLAQFGSVSQLEMPLNSRNGRPLGYAYVSIETKESAPKLAQEIDGHDFDGRRITCEPADNQPKAARSIFDFLGFGRKTN